MRTQTPGLLTLVLALSLPLGCEATSAAEPAHVSAPDTPPPVPARTDVARDAAGWETVTAIDGVPVPPPELPQAQRPTPEGFPDVDPYTSHAEACLEVVQLEVPADHPRWRKAIGDWCSHRSYHASRNGTVESKVDGSQVHDRDRVTAWMFYEHGVLDGTLDPKHCSFHAVNRKMRHPPKCHRLRKNWPFNSPKMSDRLANEWRQHPHDMERFGARGPHDWNANAYRHLPGCWDPAQLERFDVGITVTVRASLKICEHWGCKNKYDIKAHWGRRATPI